MDSNGYPIGGVGGEDGVTTNDIVSLDTTAQIELGDGAINFVASSVEIAGVPIIDINSGVSNPMLADLDANEFNINNVGEINGINLGILQNNIVTLNNKTFYIDPALSLDGTVFTNNIYALSFVKDGGSNQQYLMADGSSLQYSANSGNSNFYLYTSSTALTPNPSNGHVTYNNANQSAATAIYISHRTSDNIDIEVYFKQLSTLNEVYIQDKNLSENFIQYNITGTPNIVTNSKVEIPVTVRISGGTGATSFGSNHPVLISFFTNSIETDQRLTALESKTQNMAATTSVNTLSRSLNTLLQPADSVAIRSIDGLTNHAIFTPTAFNFYRPLNMNATAISNAASLSISGGTANDFLKANGTLDSNSYALSSDLLNYVPLTSSSAISGELTANKFIIPLGLTTQFLKANGDLDSTAYITAADVTTAIAGKLDKAGDTMSGPLNMGTNDITNIGNVAANTITLSGSPSSFLMADGTINANTYVRLTGDTMFGSLNMGSNNITGIGLVTANVLEVAGGLSTEFLKADGTRDAAQYTPTDGAIVLNSVPYLTDVGLLSSSTTNKYVQAGSNLQTAINQMVSGQGYSLTLSAGQHAGGSAIIFDRLDYAISGTKTGTAGSTSTIAAASVAIGQAGINTSLLKFSDLEFTGPVTFASQNQQSRHTFNNCVFGTTVNFPTAVIGVTGYLYFYDCVFSQAGTITLNNVTLAVKFVRCVFAGQTITINAAGNQVVFQDCDGLPSFAITNALYRGLNKLNAALTTSLTATSLSLGGAASSFVMGNGSLNATVYPTISILTGNFVFNGVNCAFQARRVSDGVNGGMVSIFVSGFLATVATTTSVFTSTAASALPVGWRPINAVFNSGRIRRLNIISTGTVIFFASGEMGLTDAIQTNNYWVAGSTNSGLASDASFSWPVL
jgi:hypothetical protein